MDVPLFPLHTVLCPGVALPLHVFEERYRSLVTHCLDTESPFGVVLIRRGREVGGGKVALALVGTLAEIREVHRYPDGRLDLLTIGTKRFRIRDVAVRREAYLVGAIEPMSEEVGDPARAQALADEASRRFIVYLELFQAGRNDETEEVGADVEIDPDVSDGPAEGPAPGLPETVDGAGERVEPPDEVAGRLLIPDDPTTLSYLLSGLVEVDLPRRQALLEASTSELRLETLVRLLDREVFLLDLGLQHFAGDIRSDASRRN